MLLLYFFRCFTILLLSVISLYLFKFCGMLLFSKSAPAICIFTNLGISVFFTRYWMRYMFNTSLGILHPNGSQVYYIYLSILHTLFHFKLSLMKVMLPAFVYITQHKRFILLKRVVLFPYKCFFYVWSPIVARLPYFKKKK